MSTSGTDWTNLNDPLDEEDEETEEIEAQDPNSDFAPAVSLTSLQLTRRRSKGSHKKTTYLPIGNIDTDEIVAEPVPQEAPAPETPAETPAAAQAAEEPQTAPDSQPQAPRDVPANLFNYWKDLRRARRFPTLADLDQDLITSHWPSSLLLRVGRGSQRPQIVKWTSTPAATPAARPERPIEYTPVMSQWIISLARRLFETGAPIHETESFLSNNGTVSYRALVLPLSEDQDHVDHALFHIGHA